MLEDSNPTAICIDLDTRGIAAFDLSTWLLVATAPTQRASFELTKLQKQFDSDSLSEDKTPAKIQNYSCLLHRPQWMRGVSFFLVQKTGVLIPNYRTGVRGRGWELYSHSNPLLGPWDLLSWAGLADPICLWAEEWVVEGPGGQPQEAMTFDMTHCCTCQNGYPTYCTGQGPLLNAMWQPRWEGSLGENGYMYMYGSVALLSTWNSHIIVNQLYSNIK